MLTWLVGLVAIVLAAILGARAASWRRTAAPPRHPLREVVAGRLVAIVVITALVALVIVTSSAIAPIVVAMIGVGVFAYWADLAHITAPLPASGAEHVRRHVRGRDGQPS